MARNPLAASSAVLGESSFWPSAAIVTAAVLYADMPARFIAGPSAGAFGIVRWVVPALTIVLLAALIASAPQGRLAQSFGWADNHVHVTRRWLALTMIGVVS